MTKNRENDKYSEVPTINKVIVMVWFLGNIFGGILAVVVAVGKFENYLHPYAFGFLCGGIGLFVGFYVANLLKSYVLASMPKQQGYFMGSFYVSVGFIGYFMLLGHYVNSGVSTARESEKFKVINKTHTIGFKRVEYHSLHFEIDGKQEALLCDKHIWNNIAVGQEVRLRLYDSPIGFDNLELAGHYY